MRKLILAASVALTGFALSAATCSWSVWGGLYEMGSTDTADGYLVYFFDNAAYSSADAKVALAANDFSFLANGFEAEYLSSGGDAEANDVGSFGNSYTIDSYMVIFNADTTANATYAYVSPAGEMASGTTGAAGQFANIEFGAQTGMQTASNWTAVNAPEPTSGLLLLLGMAGLALKRRRA